MLCFSTDIRLSQFAYCHSSLRASVFFSFSFSECRGLYPSNLRPLCLHFPHDCLVSVWSVDFFSACIFLMTALLVCRKKVSSLPECGVV